jgi:hypothetical protein
MLSGWRVGYAEGGHLHAAVCRIDLARRRPESCKVGQLQVDKTRGDRTGATDGCVRNSMWTAWDDEQFAYPSAQAASTQPDGVSRK